MGAARRTRHAIDRREMSEHQSLIFALLLLFAASNVAEPKRKKIGQSCATERIHRPVGMVEVEFEEDSKRRKSVFKFRRYPSDPSLQSQGEAFCHQFRVSDYELCACSIRDAANAYLDSLENLDDNNEQVGVRILSPADGTTLFETHVDDDYATISVFFALVSPSSGKLFEISSNQTYRIEVIFLVDEVLTFPLSDVVLKGGVSLVITRGYFGSHLFEVRVVDVEKQVVIGSAASVVEVLALRSLPMLALGKNERSNRKEARMTTKVARTTGSARLIRTWKRRKKVVILSDVGDVLDGTKAVLLQQTDALLRVGVDVEYLDTTGAKSTYGTMRRQLDELTRAMRDEEEHAEREDGEHATFGEFTLVRVELRFDLGYWDSVDAFKSSVRSELPHIRSMRDPRFEKFRGVRDMYAYWRNADADALWVTNSKIDESLAVVCHFARLVGGVESRILSIGANALDPNTTALLRSHGRTAEETEVPAAAADRWLWGMISKVTSPSRTLLRTNVVRASGLALNSFRVTVDLKRFDMSTICTAAVLGVGKNLTNEGTGRLVDNRRIRQRCNSLSSVSDALDASHSNIVRVLFAGRLVEAKSPGIFLRAAGAIIQGLSASKDAPSSPRVEFVVVGSGYLKPALVKLTRDMGVADRVIFSHGRVPHSDMPRIFASADIFAFPSIYPESFGIVCVEAMSLGIPVVGFGFGGSPDYLRHMDTGIVASPVTPMGFAAAIDLLARSPSLRRDIGNRAMKFAREGYSVHSARRSWVELYEGLFEGESAR